VPYLKKEGKPNMKGRKKEKKEPKGNPATPGKKGIGSKRKCGASDEKKKGPWGSKSITPSQVTKREKVGFQPRV